LPVAIVVGEKSEMLDPRVTVERARTLMPTVETCVIANAGHALTVSHFDECVVPLLRATEAHSI